MLIDKIGFPVSANDIKFLYSSLEFKNEIIKQIKNAQYRINVCVLYWQHDEVGQEILDIIFQTKIAKPSLEINVFVDYHRANRGLLGNKNNNETNINWYRTEQEKYGLPQDNTVKFWGVPIHAKELFGVLHMKGLIFDDVVIYSGASFNNVYLGNDDLYRYDRYHVISNKALADSMSEVLFKYILDFNIVKRLDIGEQTFDKAIKRNKHLKLAKYNVNLQKSSSLSKGAEVIVKPIFGLSKNKRYNKLNQEILSLIGRAKDTIILCTPYFNLHKEITKKLKQALKKGVKIEFIIGDKEANDFFIPDGQTFHISGVLPYFYEENLRMFMRKFSWYILSKQLIIRLWQHNNNTYHLKGIWVDDSYMLLTGHNLNPRGWKWDAENGLLIMDKNNQLSTSVAKELATIRQNTTIVGYWEELEQFNNYPNRVQKILKRLKKFKAEKIAKKIL